MKEKLGSLIQHLGSGLGFIGGWLASKDLIPPDDVTAVNGAGNSLAAALAIILAAIAIHLFGKFVKRSGGGSGGISPAILVSTAVALSMVGMLPSCSSFSLTGDGCIRSTQTREGKTYTMDVCLGADGKVDRIRLLWTNETGRELRGTIYRDDRPVVIEFRDLDTGFWYRWTEGMGLSLGAVPPEVETALENAVPLPVKVEK